MSVEQFKTMHGVSQIEVLKNEKTGKCFFAYGGGRSGAVTSRFPEEPLNNPVISEVYSENSNEPFYMLHNKNDKGATQLGVL